MLKIAKVMKQHFRWLQGGKVVPQKRLVAQHNRWFKGGKVNVSLIQNQQNTCFGFQNAIQIASKKSLVDQMAGYDKQAAKKANAIYDISQYVVPASYMTGALLLPGGIISMTILNMSVLTFYLAHSIGMYNRAIKNSGKSLSEVFAKEALHRAAAGGNKILSSKAIGWRRKLSGVTALFGLGLTVGTALVFGAAIGVAPYLVLGINTMFPALNWALLKYGS